MDRKIRTYSNLAQPVSHQGGDIEKLISRPGVIHVNPRSVETCVQKLRKECNLLKMSVG